MEAVYTELIEKKKRLNDITTALKERFLGLDDVIDEIMSLMLPWYLFPQAQLRPTIINLWGLTGSGKTALVNAIVELLDYRKLYSHLDMGEFESDSASWMKNILTDELEFFHEKSPVICLDEFQFARTVDGDEKELGKDKLRVMWDLLDSGKVEYISDSGTYYLFKAENCLIRMVKAIQAGLIIENGVITGGFDAFKRYFDGFHFEFNNRCSAKLTENYFLSDDFVMSVWYLFEGDDVSKEEIRERIRNATAGDIQMLLHQGMSTRPATKTLDLSKALIFVLGNLDEAYGMSRNLNPDISADEFHEATSRITIADIKRALKRRFRPEQIARLGNNHIIYRSFNCAQFRALIRQELTRIASFVMTQFGWKVVFDESVIDIVYSEGVFPAQGTRPVFTTVKNLVESRLSAMVVQLVETQMNIDQVKWTYANGQFHYQIMDVSGNVVLSFNDTAKLKLENLRKSVDPEIQAHVAVHESGHAVLAALTFRIIPSVVVSRTASDSEGFCLINFPKGPMTRETLKKDIMTTLGGYIAEKMIFGEEHTSSGVVADIEEASRLANNAVRNYAMGSDPIHLVVGSKDADAFTTSRRYDVQAIAIIRACETQARALLERNRLLLLKMAEYLTTHSRMEAPMIESYMKQYSVESWVRTTGFIAKDQYFRFNTAVQAHLALLEGESDPFPVESFFPMETEVND